MHLKEYAVLSSILFCVVYVDGTENKCLLPSERSTLRSNSVKVDERLKFLLPKFSMPRQVKKAGRDVFKGKSTIALKIQAAYEQAERYCGKPRYTTKFPGFALKDFDKKSVCAGSWGIRKIQTYYQDPDTNWHCWTLRPFAKLNCPTYNCNSGFCQGLKDKTTSPTVTKYRCEISGFVDIPFYVYCYPPKGVGFEFKPYKMVVSRCCNCSKFTCSK
ncbi:Hypothetical predicted protein [Mytilus galloprovincialis]|uniref:Uncharacterized protein n=1 Tax=Mytilus galloprovincialis TaxID=29158 RepID=A0A8B6H4V0_MYTGA|nr:Hypothetical predicted protein [Mytilus galloprovincialis]